MVELTNKVIFVNNHKTSIRMAKPEWDAFESICNQENISRNEMIEMINKHKNDNLGLTCSVRLFSLIYFYKLLTANQTSNNNTSTPIFEAIREIS